MLVFSTISTLRAHLDRFNNKTTIAFIPTMGALHKGHLSLIKKAQKETDISIVSIFVNPTQFDNSEDLVKYPKTLTKDLDLLKSINCDVVFTPSVFEIYADDIKSRHFNFGGIEHEMEGEFRDGHFDGVGTIVKRLFEIVKPNKAYFGEKDFQQLQIIKKLVDLSNLDIDVIGCKIFREKNGLAMSSRNARLSKEHKNAAPFIYKTLKKAKNKFTTKSPKKVTKWVYKKFKKQPLLELEYFVIADEKTLKTTSIKEDNHKYRGFIAVFAGEIRLIDNIGL
jgi:pantoate--beta-alanine ligase